MTDARLDDLLTKFCAWLFQQSSDYGSTAADDLTGDVVMALNKNNPVWFLPGTWGTRQAEIRNIRVPYGTPLFVVVGCSHITPHELKGIPKPKKDDMENRRDDIARLWDTANLTVDGVKYEKEQLLEAKTGMSYVYVTPGGYYDRTYGASGLIPMMSSGYVAMIDSLGNVNTDHTITIEANSVDGTPKGVPEPPYEIKVTYKIKVGY